jgi:hypothetical protein
MINLKKLTKELSDAGIKFVSVNSDGVILNSAGAEIQGEQAPAAVVATHDPTDYEKARSDGAEGAARTVNGWATMTEADAIAWIDDNLGPELLADFPKTLAAIKIIARMLIALIGKTFPGIRGQQPD